MILKVFFACFHGLSVQAAELEQKVVQLEADNVALRSQLADGASKVVQALKESKEKDREIQAIRSKLTAAEKQVADLTKAHQELSSSMAKAEGTLHRAATLSGLDANVRQEFNEVSFFSYFKKTSPYCDLHKK